jgi:hypothetical protein
MEVLMLKISVNDSNYIIDFVSPTELKVRKVPFVAVGMKKATPCVRPRLEKQPTMAAQEKPKFGIIPVESLAKQGDDTTSEQAKTALVKNLLLEIGKQMGIQL